MFGGLEQLLSAKSVVTSRPVSAEDQGLHLPLQLQ